METKFFLDMSEDELHDFAVSMVKTINSEKLFSDDTSFEFVSVELDEFNGGLWIEISTGDNLEVTRPATWQAADEDDIEEAEDIDFANSIYKDVENMFKTISVELEGYKVELNVADIGDTEVVDMIPGDIRHEDSGIGSYEYGDIRGYDSHPYVETTGTVVEACDCYISFFVEPLDNNNEEAEVEEEI